MRITLHEPELELEVNKVDTPTGTGWCVIMPDWRKVLIKFHNGKWESEDNVNNQFVQAIGDGISQVIEVNQQNNYSTSYNVINQRPKRLRMLKFLFI